MRFQSWCISDTGLKRKSNQDSFLIDERLGVFIVADGVGGHMGGEVASSVAVETVREVVGQHQSKNSDSKQLIKRAYEEASHIIFDRAAKDNQLEGMGTTMVLGYFFENKIFIGNVGDSRCYLFRKPYIWQLTEDHSLVNEQIRLGLMTEEQARKTIAKNMITRSVGFERDVFPDILEREVSAGDIYVLCSDGLTGMVTDEKIAKVILETPIDHVAETLIQKALQNGGDDNVTVLVLSFSET
jgi:PPM family protein phosphatase